MPYWTVLHHIQVKCSTYTTFQAFNTLLWASFALHQVFPHQHHSLLVLPQPLHLQHCYLPLVYHTPQYPHLHYYHHKISISSNLIHLQIISNVRTMLYEHDISNFYDISHLQAHEHVCFHEFTIANEQIFGIFCIKLTPLLIKHHCLCNTSEHAHVRTASFFPLHVFLE